MTYCHIMRPYRILLIGILLMMCSEIVNAQAFCALRDPVRRVYQMFPESTAYRTITSTVGPEHRASLLRELPFAHHFNEFGRHSLYVALQDGKPIGLIHVRSEKGRWGLVEICWALDFDLNILGFEFQRCRDPQCAKITDGPVEDFIVGSNFETLAKSVKEGDFLESIPESQRTLAMTMLQSALKTISLTDTVWREELISLRAPFHAESAFESGIQLEPILAAPKRVDDVGFDLIVWGEWAIQDAQDQPLGKLIMSSLLLPGFSDDLWWVVDEKGSLISIECQSGWPDEATASAFQQLIGRSILDIKDCATASELAAEAVLTKQASP